jgi:ABC-type sugar transport system ATPase subunit
MRPVAPPPSQTGAVPLVEMRDIRVAFGGLYAVDGVSVDLYPGEVVALVGGNGAGKSTMMHTLSGAHPADSGQILINGEPVTIHVPRDAQKHGIETIYQKLALADNIDAAGNVFLGREMRTLHRRARRLTHGVGDRRGDAPAEPAVHQSQDSGEVAVKWPAPSGGDRPSHLPQRQDPDHG